MEQLALGGVPIVMPEAVQIQREKKFSNGVEILRPRRQRNACFGILHLRDLGRVSCSCLCE